MRTAIDIRQWENGALKRPEMWIDMLEREIGIHKLTTKKSAVKWKQFIELLENHILTPAMRKQIDNLPCPITLAELNQQLFVIYATYKN